MANGYTKRINESFSNYIDRLNESTDNPLELSQEDKDKLWAIADRYNTSTPVSGMWETEITHERKEIAKTFNISEEEAEQLMISELGFSKDQFVESLKLNEAVPRDLMSKIKDTRRYKSAQRYGDDSIDYDSADMQEITAADVMRMKKRGEDLSNIYVLSDNGNLIELDMEGHPMGSGSTYYERANQSLNKTLSNAAKIYKGKIGYFSKTQPDKWAERTSDTGRRWANKKLGNERLSGWDERQIKEFRKHLDGPTEEISAIRKEYEDGDISRKEMEARIAELKDEYKYRAETDHFFADAYNEVKNKRADARYYDSNKAARKNMDAYEEAKYDLKRAKYKLKDNEEGLARAQAGDGYGSQRVIDLKRKIATLKRDLEYYEKELAENPAQKELTELQTGIDEATQKIKDNQEIIDRLLHRNRNESFKKKFNKRLNETSTALPSREKRQPNRDYLIHTLMWGDIKGAVLDGNYKQAAELLRNFADEVEQLAVDPYKQFNVEVTLNSKLDGKSIFRSPKEKIKWLENVLGDGASVSKAGPNTFNVMVVADKYDNEAEDRISSALEKVSDVVSQYKISDLETL